MISRLCYLSKARWYASIPHCDNLWRLPNRHNPSDLPTPMNSGDKSPMWGGVNVACDITKTSPGGANSARSWGSKKHIGCGPRSYAAQQIGRWGQSLRWPSPRCPSPQCPSPRGAPRWLNRRQLNQSSGYRGRNWYCVRVRVRLLWCLFSLLEYIYPRQ